MNSNGIIIAIDGPAGAGKSSVAKLLSEKLGYRYIDTGAMYRSVALVALHQQVNLTDEGALGVIAKNFKFEFKNYLNQLQVWVNDEDVTSKIRTPEVTAASFYSANALSVRTALVELQRKMALESCQLFGGAILEGRDTGTIVYPQAQYKFFLNATVEKRAERRLKDMLKAGMAEKLDVIIQQIKARDEKDYQREYGGLKKTEDYILMDHTMLTVDESAHAIYQYILEHPR
jgi:cytidylate kinase